MNFKYELIQKETEKLNTLLLEALKHHHIRESWINNDCTYNTAGKVIPDSVIEFTKIYFEGLNKVINEK